MPAPTFSTAAQISAERIKDISERLMGTTSREKREYSADHIHSRVVGRETLQNIALYPPEVVARDLEDMQLSLDSDEGRSATPASSLGGSAGAAASIGELSTSLKDLTLRLLAYSNIDLPLWLLVADYSEKSLVKDAFMNLLAAYAKTVFENFRELILDETGSGHDFGKLIVQGLDEDNSRKYLSLLNLCLTLDPASGVNTIYEILTRETEAEGDIPRLSLFACLKGNSGVVYEDYQDLIISMAPKLSPKQLTTLFKLTDIRQRHLGMCIFSKGGPEARQKYTEYLKTLPPKDLAAILAQKNNKVSSFIDYCAYYAEPALKEELFKFINQQLDLAIRDSDKEMLKALSSCFASPRLFKDLVARPHTFATIEIYLKIIGTLEQYHQTRLGEKLGLSHDEAIGAVVDGDVIETLAEHFKLKSPEQRRDFILEMALLIKADLLDDEAMLALKAFSNEIAEVLVNPPEAVRSAFPENHEAVFEQCFRAMVDRNDPFYKYFNLHSGSWSRLHKVLEAEYDRVLTKLQELDHKEPHKLRADTENLLFMQDKLVEAIFKSSNKVALSLAAHDSIAHPNLYAALDNDRRKQLGTEILAKHLDQVLAYISEGRASDELNYELSYLAPQIAEYIVSLGSSAFSYVDQMYRLDTPLGKYFASDPAIDEKCHQIFLPVLKNNLLLVIAGIETDRFSEESLKLLVDLKDVIAAYIKKLDTEQLARLNRHINDPTTGLGKFFALQRGSLPTLAITGTKGGLNRALLARRFRGDKAVPEQAVSAALPAASGLSGVASSHVEALVTAPPTVAGRRRAKVDLRAPDDEGAIEMAPMSSIRREQPGAANAEPRPGKPHH